MMKKVLLFIALALMLNVPTYAKKRDAVSRVFTSSCGVELPYQIIYPANFNPKESYPLLLFLHGAGERGNDNVSQLKHGGNMLLSSNELKNVIVIIPQCPADSYWVNHKTEDISGDFFYSSPEISDPLCAVMQLVNSLQTLGIVDSQRIYATGISMGGMAVYDLLCRFPNLFAAVQPICGAIHLDRISSLVTTTPLRIFHGSIDSVVPVHYSRDIYMILKSKGNEVDYIEIPNCEHNSWDTAFARKDFLSWMLSKSRN